MKYLILGSGIAAMTAAEEIRKRESSAEIKMITREEKLCVNRPMLIRDFALDGSGASLFDGQEKLPDQYGIEMIRGVGAETINPSDKTVNLDDGRQMIYDKLIYAIGADACIPDIPGADRDNVFPVRTLADTERIRKAIENSRYAVVIGGGMLGLEDAWALYEEGLQVAVIEQRQRVAFAQIDGSAGNLMKKRIERFDVDLYLDARPEEIGEGFVTFVNEKNSELVTIPADMIVMSTGVVPNIDVGARAGLEVLDSRDRRSGWIKIDEHCRTSDPDIFAAGDVAAFEEGDAIWDAARMMGRVAGANAVIDDHRENGEETGDPRPVYSPVVAEHVFNGFDTEIVTVADSSGAGTDGVYLRHADVEVFDYQRERYIRVSLQDGRIAGILLINASELAPPLMEALRRGEGENEARTIIQEWKRSHEVDFKPAAPFRKR